MPLTWQDDQTWRLRHWGRWGATWEDWLGVKFLWHEVEERYCSFIELLLLFIFIFLQVGKIKATSKRGLKILRINCQNLTLIMTNGIRKVREGVNIFDKRILDSCKFISDSASEYGLIYNNLFLAEYKLHGAQSIRILHVSKGGGREA